LFEGNNTGLPQSSISASRDVAINIATGRSGEFASLDVPVLVPVFNRPILDGHHLYTHSLNSDPSASTNSGYERIDLQSAAMEREAQAELRNIGNTINNQIFMNGFSAGSMFANRFTLLHPDLVEGVAAGASPILPVETIDGSVVPFPLGPGGMQQVAGAPFDIKTFRNVPFYAYVASADANNVLNSDTFDSGLDLVNRYMTAAGQVMATGWAAMENYWSRVAGSAAFNVYDGVRHTHSPMLNDVVSFFQNLLDGPHNQMSGSSGNDGITGTDNKPKPDRIMVGEGDDVVRAGKGNDIISGESGADLIYGEDGADVIVGASGADTMYGGQDDSTMLGGDGNDTLFGNRGNDLLIGGGSDVFVFSSVFGADQIVDFSGGDKLSFIGVAGIASAAAVLATATTGAEGVTLNLSSGHTVTLLGVSASSLRASDIVVA